MTMKTLITLTLLLYACAPYAVKFHSYVNDKGETVFSNVPQNCTKNSALTCLQYHPVMSSSRPQNVAVQAEEQPDPVVNTRSSKPGLSIPRAKTTTDQQLDLLESMAEGYRLVNQYFPGKPDPTDAHRARQQQEGILDVLQVIRKAAGNEDVPPIDKAIDILRSNLVE